jgi:hypothetical protein
MSAELAQHLAAGRSVAELLQGIASASPPISVVAQSMLEGGKVETRFADGSRLLRFKNGTEREVRLSFAAGPSAGGSAETTTVRFANGDVKRSLPCGTELYYYAAARTLQTSYAPGAGRGSAPGSGSRPGFEVYEFLETGQIELHWAGGRGTEVLFPDGSVTRN